MEKRKVLIVSCTKFYGGGEIFVSRVFPQLEEYYDFFYQVRSKDLYEILPFEHKFFIEHEVSLSEKLYLRGNDSTIQNRYCCFEWKSSYIYGSFLA